MPKKSDNTRESEPGPKETDVLRRMLSTPPEPQKEIPKTKKAGK